MPFYFKNCFLVNAFGYLQFRDALLRRHKHLYEKQKHKENGNMSRLPLIRSLAEIGRNHSSSKSEYEQNDVKRYFLL